MEDSDNRQLFTDDIGLIIGMSNRRIIVASNLSTDSQTDDDQSQSRDSPALSEELLSPQREPNAITLQSTAQRVLDFRYKNERCNNKVNDDDCLGMMTQRSSTDVSPGYTTVVPGT